MDSSFQVLNHGLSDFDIPGNMGMCWNSQGGIRETLVLNGKREELVKAATNLGRKGPSEAKNVAALRSHCEAERRRRERINGHLASLRNFVPCTDKMDKATLLAEVISQVKVLKKQASEATKGLLIPTDADEVTVESCNGHEGQSGDFTFRASICCDYKPEIISEIRQAISSLKLTITKAEISTLGNRVKSVFITVLCKDEIALDCNSDRFAKSIEKALCSVLEKMTASEYLPKTAFPNKRRRFSFSDNSMPSQ